MKYQILVHPYLEPWRRGVVVIVNANRTEDRVFEPRRGVRFLGLYTLQYSSLKLYSHCYCLYACTYASEINVQNIFLKRLCSTKS
jgi:hypothetical protein